MLDLVIGLLKSLLNCRTKNWVKTTNPAKQGGQQQLEGEIIRAERLTRSLATASSPRFAGVSPERFASALSVFEHLMISSANMTASRRCTNRNGSIIKRIRYNGVFIAITKYICTLCHMSVT